MRATESIAIRTAAIQGASVWWSYAVLETAFAIGFPLARKVLSRAVPSLLPNSPTPFVSAALTVVVLAALPVLGAALGGIQAACLSFSLGPRKSKAADEPFWSAVALLTLASVFGLNAVLARQGAVAHAIFLPLGLGFARLALAWRPDQHPFLERLTHPVPVALILVGGAFIAQPRPYFGRLAAASIEAAFAGCVVLLVLAVGPLHSWSLRYMGSHAGSLRVSLVLIFSCGLVLAATPTMPKQVLLHRAVAVARPHDRRPNVILITLDTVRADHLSIHGYGRETSPFLKTWVANDATLYTRSIATSNWTLPTHASIFTGQGPSVHGARRSRESGMGVAISVRTPMLAEILARAGYRTAGVAANADVLIPQFGFDRGFSEYDASSLADIFVPGGRDFRGRGYLLRESVRRALATLIAPERKWASSANADAILGKARAFLDSAAGGSQPFFLFLNFMDAHDPYVPPPEFATRFPGRAPGFRWGSFRPPEDDEGRLVQPLSPEETLHLTSQYDGAIAYLDDRLRDLVESLRTLGLYDNSLIIVTADHGEGFGEHGYLYHRRSLYQEQVHVPLVVKYPRATKGEIVNALVSAVDLLPTVLEVVGEAAPPGIEGRSLREAGAAPRWVAAEASNIRPNRGGSRGNELDEVALFSGFLKRILKRDGSAETYDLLVDPGETKNRDRDLRLPAEWNVEYLRYLQRGAGVPAPTPVTDPEVVRRLRSLGYLR